MASTRLGVPGCCSVRQIRALGPTYFWFEPRDDRRITGLEDRVPLLDLSGACASAPPIRKYGPAGPCVSASS